MLCSSASLLPPRSNAACASATRQLGALLLGVAPALLLGKELPAPRVEPNVVTFNTLVSQLMFEGDVAGARRVVEEDMPAAGVKPDDRTLETLN